MLFQGKVIRVGEGSVGVTIPAPISKAHRIKIGDEILVNIKKVNSRKLA